SATDLEQRGAPVAELSGDERPPSAHAEELEPRKRTEARPGLVAAQQRVDRTVAQVAGGQGQSRGAARLPRGPRGGERAARPRAWTCSTPGPDSNVPPSGDGSPVVSAGIGPSP